MQSVNSGFRLFLLRRRSIEIKKSGDDLAWQPFNWARLDRTQLSPSGKIGLFSTTELSHEL